MLIYPLQLAESFKDTETGIPTAWNKEPLKKLNIEKHFWYKKSMLRTLTMVLLVSLHKNENHTPIFTGYEDNSKFIFPETSAISGQKVKGNRWLRGWL